jgi:hypothetical protein
MVDLKGCRYGLDWAGTEIRLVGSSVSDGYSRINSLDRFDNLDSAGNSYSGDSELYFSVSDEEAIIKRIKIPSGQTLDRRKVALFELSCSLPGDADKFYIETIVSDGQMESLGIAYRKMIIDEKIAVLEKGLARPSGFKIRSLALAAGYFGYCRPAGGEMICLLDISGGLISYAFLYSRHPIAIGGIKITGEDKSNGGLDENRLIDLVTVIQYQKLQLFNSGYSAPLSLVIVSGADANEESCGRIGDKIRIRTSLPSFRPEPFSDGLHSSAVAYLVGLGLTAE